MNVKVALLIGLGAITTMCWLVNQAAHLTLNPADTSFAGPVAPSGHAPPVSRSYAAAIPTPARADRFTHASAVEPVKQAAESIDDELLAPAPPRRARLIARSELPPLFTPDEPAETAVATEPPSRRPPTLAAQIAAEDGEAGAAGGEADGAISHETPAVALARGAGANENTTSAAPVGSDPAGAAADRPARYRVQRGDSLARVAQRTWGSQERRFIELLLAANPALKKRGGRLLEGEELVLPGAAVTTVAAASPRAAPQAAARAALTEPYTSYRIQKGDSLERIAQRLLNDRSRWREIAELNRLKNQDRLVPGTTIRVPKQST